MSLRCPAASPLRGEPGVGTVRGDPGRGRSHGSGEEAFGSEGSLSAGAEAAPEPRQARRGFKERLQPGRGAGGGG